MLVVQIAICAVLVTSSLVAVRGLVRSLHGNFGFEPRNAHAGRIPFCSMAGYSGDRVPAMQRRMIDAVETIPGVESVGLVNYPPFSTAVDNAGMSITDQTTDLSPSNAAAISLSSTPCLPNTSMRRAPPCCPEGRFTWHDDKDAPRVAVVNREFARKIFGSVNKRDGQLFQDGRWNARASGGYRQKTESISASPKTQQPAMFLPFLQCAVQLDNPGGALGARSAATGGQPSGAHCENLDAGLPFDIQTWNEEMDGALFAPHVATVSLGVLGVMGAMLSITGIFGMAAYSVSKRLRELGIRMALGAQRKEVLQAALGRPLKLLAFGSAAGLLLGILAARVLAYIVYQATPRDPLVLAGRRSGDVVAGAPGHVDSRATRAVGRSVDTAARGVNSS